MGRGTVRGERRYGGGRHSASARGCQGDGAAGRGGVAAIDPLAECTAFERAAAGDRQDGSGGSRGWRGDAGRLQARASTRGSGWAGIVARGPGTTWGAGNRAEGERVPVRGRRRILSQDGAAGVGGVRRGADCRDGVADLAGMGHGGGGGEAGAAGGFAEVSGVLAGGDLPAGRDVAGGGGRGRGTTATRAVRCAAAQVGEARGASDDDAAQRTASAVSEQPGSEVGEERRGPAGEG